MGALIQLSRFSYLRHPHSNPKNIHTVTDMQEWIKTHPMHDVQKITKQILEIPQRNMELSQDIVNATMKCWMSIMFGVLWENNTAEEKRKN